jgi:glycolate oxidase FAD binding subunit
MSILTPSTEAEGADAVNAARTAGRPLAIRGGGTRPIGRPEQAAETRSLEKLIGITLYEPAERVIGARVGTPLAEIEAALAAKGQMLAFEPMDHRPLLGTSGEPSIGAVAAANISGPRRIHSGAARDSLIGVRFVNGRGEAVKNGGRVMKNVTGLDLVKLQAGAFGTLGVLTEVIFKVVPAYETGGTLVLEGLDAGQAVAALSAALGSPYEVTGAAHLSAGLDDRPARTLIRIEGFESSVRYRLDALRKLVAGTAPARILRGEDHAALWRAVRDVTPLSQPRDEAVWRISVAPSKAPGIVAAIGTCRALHDWGGGLIWLGVPAAEDAGVASIRAAVAAVGGHATLLRADEGLRARVEVFTPPAPGLARIVAGIKASFDPDRILNPGLMHAGV